MNLTDENGVGKEIGQGTISESQYGLVFSPMRLFSSRSSLSLFGLSGKPKPQSGLPTT